MPILVPLELASTDPAEYRLRFQRLGLVDGASHLEALPGEHLATHARAMGWDLRWSILLRVDGHGAPASISVDVARQRKPMPIDPAGDWQPHAAARAELARSIGCAFDGCWLAVEALQLATGAAQLSRALGALPALGWHVEQILLWHQSVVDRGGLPPEPWMTAKLGGIVALPALGIDWQPFHTAFTFLGAGTVAEWRAALEPIARANAVTMTVRDDWVGP